MNTAQLRAQGGQEVDGEGQAQQQQVPLDIQEGSAPLRASAIDAAKLGFAARVIESATRAIDLDGSKGAAQQAMRAAGVTLT